MIVHCKSCKTVVAEGAPCPSCGHVNMSAPELVDPFQGMSGPAGRRPPSRSTRASASSVRNVIGAVVLGVAAFLAVRHEYSGNHGDPAKLQAALTNLQSVTDGKTVKAANAPTSAPSSDASLNDVAANVVNQMAVAASDLRQKREHIGAEIAALHLHDILSPEHLSSASGIQESRQSLVRYAELLNEFDATGKDYMQRVTTIFDALPEPHRTEAMTGFNSSSAQMQQAMAAYEGSLRDIHDTMVSVLDLMEPNLGRIQRRDGKLLMPPEVLTQYQTLMTKMQFDARQMQQQEAQIAELQQRGRQVVADLQGKLSQQ